jgi:hypothetical protein
MRGGVRGSPSPHENGPRVPFAFICTVPIDTLSVVGRFPVDIRLFAVWGAKITVDEGCQWSGVRAALTGGKAEALLWTVRERSPVSGF